MSDLVERVAKASYEAGVLYWKQRNSFIGSALPEWIDLGPGNKETMRTQTRAALAVFVEEAAKVADKRVDELVALRESSPLGDGPLSWSYYNSLIGEAEKVAAAIRKLGEE